MFKVNVRQESYWPTVNKNVEFGSSTVKLLSSFMNDRDEWIVRKIKVIMVSIVQLVLFIMLFLS